MRRVASVGCRPSAAGAGGGVRGGGGEEGEGAAFFFFLSLWEFVAPAFVNCPSHYPIPGSPPQSELNTPPLCNERPLPPCERRRLILLLATRLLSARIGPVLH